MADAHIWRIHINSMAPHSLLNSQYFFYYQNDMSKVRDPEAFYLQFR